MALWIKRRTKNGRRSVYAIEGAGHLVALAFVALGIIAGLVVLIVEYVW